MTTTRVYFREGQVLHAADLKTEQSYLLAMHRRHQIAHHGWGIVTGLALIGGDNQTDFVLTAGLAIDGYGRELIVANHVPITQAMIKKVSDEQVDLWLLYNQTTTVTNGTARCEESPILWLTGPDEVATPSQRQASEWRDERKTLRDPTDDADRTWPMYLGTFVKNNAEPTKRKIQTAGRPYVSLVGERVTAPSRQVRLQVGSEITNRRERFAVSLPNPTQGEDQPPWVDWFTINNKGDLTIKGNASIDGDLSVQSAIHVEPSATPPILATPWQIYHTVVAEEGAGTAAGDTQSLDNQASPPPKVNQLRFEILDPGDKAEPTRNQFTIGVQQTTGAQQATGAKQATGAQQNAETSGTQPNKSQATYAPCLTIQADGTVIMHGAVAVEGLLVDGPVQPSQSDPRFKDLLVEEWLRGQGAAATQSEVFHKTLLALEVSAIATMPQNGQNYADYEVFIKNQGSADIANIQIFETLVTAAGPLPMTRVYPQDDQNPGLTVRPYTIERPPEPIRHFMQRLQEQGGKGFDPGTAVTVVLQAQGTVGGFNLFATVTQIVNLKKRQGV